MKTLYSFGEISKSSDKLDSLAYQGSRMSKRRFLKVNSKERSKKRKMIERLRILMECIAFEFRSEKRGALTFGLIGHAVLGV
jgi:hypothetical protein